MKCPRCKSPLLPKTVKDIHTSIQVDYCSSCGGTWFDQGELSRLDKVSEPTFLEIRRIPSAKAQMESMSCPACGDLHTMEKAEHPRDQRVILDYCPSCKGIWLDKGELKAIQKENWFTTLGKIFGWLLSNKEE